MLCTLDNKSKILCSLILRNVILETADLFAHTREVNPSLLCLISGVLLFIYIQSCYEDVTSYINILVVRCSTVFC